MGSWIESWTGSGVVTRMVTWMVTWMVSWRVTWMVSWMATWMVTWMVTWMRTIRHSRVLCMYSWQRRTAPNNKIHQTAPLHTILPCPAAARP